MNNTEREDILNRLGEAVSRFNKEVSDILKPADAESTDAAKPEAVPSAKKRGRPPKPLTFAEKMAIRDGRKPRGWSTARFNRVRERELASIEAETSQKDSPSVQPRMSAADVRKSMGWE